MMRTKTGDIELDQLYEDLERYEEILTQKLSVKDRRFFKEGVKNIKEKIKYYE